MINLEYEYLTYIPATDEQIWEKDTITNIHIKDIDKMKISIMESHSHTYIRNFKVVKDEKTYNKVRS